MKLEKVNSGHKFLAKMKLGMFGVVAGGRAPMPAARAPTGRALHSDE